MLLSATHPPPPPPKVIAWNEVDLRGGHEAQNGPRGWAISFTAIGRRPKRKRARPTHSKDGSGLGKLLATPRRKMRSPRSRVAPPRRYAIHAQDHRLPRTGEQVADVVFRVSDITKLRGRSYHRAIRGAAKPCY